MDVRRGVNLGGPALTHAGARGNQSGVPPGPVGDRLACSGDGPENHHLNPTFQLTDQANRASNPARTGSAHLPVHTLAPASIDAQRLPVPLGSRAGPTPNPAKNWRHP
jgi:hypothetical protein